jgi:hypothetical protein
VTITQKLSRRAHFLSVSGNPAEFPVDGGFTGRVDLQTVSVALRPFQGQFVPVTTLLPEFP